MTVGAAMPRIAGVRMRAGDGVVVSLPAANRDESLEGDPEALDLNRRPHEQVAFGFGPHQCLGQNLARAELAVVYRTLLSQPGLRLAVPPEDLEWLQHEAIHGLRRLPVEW